MKAEEIRRVSKGMTDEYQKLVAKAQAMGGGEEVLNRVALGILTTAILEGVAQLAELNENIRAWRNVHIFEPSSAFDECFKCGESKGHTNHN